MADAAKDPREKVAVLDTIDYLKLPDVQAAATPDSATNIPPAITLPKELSMNPKFLHKAKRAAQATNNGQPPPTSTPANQTQ